MDRSTQLEHGAIIAALDLDLRAGRRRIRQGFALTILLVAVATAWWWFGNSDTEGPKFTTVEIYRGDLTVTVQATGTLEPTVQVEVGSELSGTIESVDVDYNDKVTKGQVLARLDTDLLAAKVVQSEAALQSADAKLLEAEANRTEAGRQLYRAEQLRKQNAVSAQDLEASQAAFDRAKAIVANGRAQVAMAAANLEADRTVLAKAVIVSPIDGIVLARHVEPGQTVAASLQAPVLFTLAENLASMELRVDVDEADIGQVRVGQAGSFSVDAYPDQVFPTEITSLRFAPKSVDGVVTYEAVLTVTNDRHMLRPGMTAAVDVVVYEATDVLLASNAALRFTPPGRAGLEMAIPIDSTHVWVLQAGNSRPIPVEVRVGHSDSRSTEIFSVDIEPGTSLVTGIDASSDRKRDSGFSFLRGDRGRG